MKSMQKFVGVGNIFDNAGAHDCVVYVRRQGFIKIPDRIELDIQSLMIERTRLLYHACGGVHAANLKSGAGQQVAQSPRAAPIVEDMTARGNCLFSQTDEEFTAD